MRIRWVIVVVVVVALWRLGCRNAPPSAESPAGFRIATFNIENFPHSREQIDGAFDELAQLGASIVALQEIEDPPLVAREARIRLGGRWEFVHTPTGPLPALREHHIGVLFDRRLWTLRSTTVHDETRLENRRHKPTYEVRLAPAAGGPIVRVLVVHLKSGSDGRPLRARQLIALESIARAAMASGERVVLLGDFNATDDDGDRGDLARLARTSGMTWASEQLPCSAFWSRDDGCPRSRLDHLLAWTAPGSVAAGGGCAAHGCQWQDRCPIYAERVSDHCPVVADFE